MHEFRPLSPGFAKLAKIQNGHSCTLVQNMLDRSGEPASGCERILEDPRDFKFNTNTYDLTSKIKQLITLSYLMLIFGGEVRKT